MECTSEMKFKSDSEQNRGLDSNAIFRLHPTSDRCDKRSDPVVLEREIAHEFAASKQTTNVPKETTITSEEALERELEFRKRRKIAMVQASIDSGSLFTSSQVLPPKPSLPGMKPKAVSENLSEQKTYGSEDQRSRTSPNGSPVQERTKHRNNHGQSSTAQPAPSQVPSALQPPQQIPSRSPLCSRIVTTGRKINFQFLEKEGFVIGQKIKRLGWEFLCSLDILTYPNLVREFFGSAKFGDRNLESEVRGVRIRLDDERLAQILKMSTDGSTSDRLENRSTGLRYILDREDIGELVEVSANQLSIEMRLLHHMASRIFFPKIGRFDLISARDITFMYHVIREISLNLPSLMISHMKEVASRQKASLPYGMVLTLVFQEFGVDLEGETARALMHSDTYDDRSLRRMGFQKVNGRWLRKGAVQTEVDDDDDDDDEIPITMPTAEDVRTEEPTEQHEQTRVAPPQSSHPEGIDQLFDRVNEDAIVERVSTRIVTSVCAKIQIYTLEVQQARRDLMEALSLVREESARLIQAVNSAREDVCDRTQSSEDIRSSTPI